jgi:hypothetical protein
MPGPIMFDNKTWIVMRSHPTLPSGIIAHLEVTDPRGNKVWKYRAVRWAADSKRRALIGYYDSLDQADAAVTNVRPIIETSRSDPSYAKYPDHPIR